MNIFRWPIEKSQDDILLLVHVKGLRAHLRALNADSPGSSAMLSWEEWAAHARLMVLRPPPIPERMGWYGPGATTGMRMALWLECWQLMETPLSPLVFDYTHPALRQLVIIDAHPRRAKRASSTQARAPMALCNDMRGTGYVRPFKDENVYPGGLECVEHVYVLPPEVSRERLIFGVAATTLDGVVLRSSTLLTFICV